mgnify:CR=1 FL=1
MKIVEISRVFSNNPKSDAFFIECVQKQINEYQAKGFYVEVQFMSSDSNFEAFLIAREQDGKDKG